jgi:hypothetical protein
MQLLQWNPKLELGLDHIARESGAERASENARNKA